MSFNMQEYCCLMMESVGLHIESEIANTCRFIIKSFKNAFIEFMSARH